MNIQVSYAIGLVMLTILSACMVIPEEAEADGSDVADMELKLDAEIKDDGEVKIEFKILWGGREFEDSKIFKPDTEKITWTEFQDFSDPEYNTTRMDILFGSDVGDTGKKLTHSPKFLFNTVLGLDSKTSISDGDIKDYKVEIIREFKEIDVTCRADISETTFTIKPLKFAYDLFEYTAAEGYKVSLVPDLTFHIRTAPNVVLQTMTIALNHFMLDEGERFSNEPVIENYDIFEYDIEEDEIQVRRHPRFIASDVLLCVYGIMMITSMVMVGMARRKAGKKWIKLGFSKWFWIGAFYLFAFIPFHFYLTCIVIMVGLLTSLRKASEIKKTAGVEPRKKKKAKKDKGKEEEEEKGEESVEDDESFSRPDGGDLLKMPMPISTAPDFSGQSEFRPAQPAASAIPEVAGENMGPQVSSPFPPFFEALSYMQYFGTSIVFNVKLLNTHSTPISDIRISPIISGDAFHVRSEEKLSALRPGDANLFSFVLHPTGMLMNANIGGTVQFFDPTASEYSIAELKPCYSGIKLPSFFAKPVSDAQWEIFLPELKHVAENMEEIQIPARIFFGIINQTMRHLNLHPLPMEYDDTGGRFIGTSRFFGEGSDGTAYALRIAITGNDSISNLKLSLWSSDSSSLTGLYFNAIYYIATRMQEERTQEYIVLEEIKEVKAPVVEDRTPESPAETKTPEDQVAVPAAAAPATQQQDFQKMMYEVNRAVRDQFRNFARQVRSAASIDDVFEAIFPFKIEEIFIIDETGGRLIMHESTGKKSKIDRDVVGGMLQAIQDFVQDSFNAEEGGGIDELQLGNLHILIERAPFIYMAVVTSGEKPAQIRNQLQGCLDKIEEKFYDMLKDWDGDTTKLKGIRKILKRFISEISTIPGEKDYGSALDLLEKVRDEAMAAREKGMDMTQVKLELMKARTAFKNSDYTEAYKLAEKVKGLIKEFKKKSKRKKDEGKEEQAQAIETDGSGDHLGQSHEEVRSGESLDPAGSAGPDQAHPDEQVAGPEQGQVAGPETQGQVAGPEAQGQPMDQMDGTHVEQMQMQAPSGEQIPGVPNEQTQEPIHPPGEGNDALGGQPGEQPITGPSDPEDTGISIIDPKKLEELMNNP